MHLNKCSGGNPLYRVSGRLAFIAAARAVYLIARDPQGTEQRLMLHLKNNLSRDERGFRHVVNTADNDVPYIEWSTHRVLETAGEILATVTEETPRERAAITKDREAAEWLRKELRDRWIEAASIYRRAERALVSASDVSSEQLEHSES